MGHRRHVDADPPMSEADLRRAKAFIERKAAHLAGLSKADIERMSQEALARADREAILRSARVQREQLQRRSRPLVRRQSK
jgi:SpoVK/Ycf46/Vps4 family AAA+-type ATPase